MRAIPTKDSGFSLVELMVTVAIIGILSAIAIASYVMATGNTQSVACKSNQRILTEAAIAYESGNEIPLSDIQDLAPYTSSNLGKILSCPTGDGTDLSYNPSKGMVTCSNHPL